MSGLETPAKSTLRFNGYFLKTIRIRYGWTMEELAAKLNVSTVSISYWESERYQPRKSKVERIAKLFRLKPDGFYYLPAETEVEES